MKVNNFSTKSTTGQTIKSQIFMQKPINAAIIPANAAGTTVSSANISRNII